MNRIGSPAGTLVRHERVPRTPPHPIKSNASDPRTAGFAADTQYGGRTLAAAIEFHSALEAASSWRSRLAVWRDLRGAVALLALMARTPSVTVRLTDSAAGRSITEHLRHRNRWRPPTNRVVQGALLLPHSADAYRRGRSRQALRTNVRRAEALGLVCRPVGDVNLDGLARHSFVGASPHRDLLNEADGRRCWVVLDPVGDPVGMAVAVVDRDVALLLVAESTFSSATWLLNLRVSEALIESGVRLLLVNERHVLHMRSSIRYVQRLLGYSVVHVSLGSVPPLRRYLVAGLARAARMLLHAWKPTPPPA